MAYTKIVFENPKIGNIKEAPVGFSWTVFFFGFFPPLFRGDWKWAIIMLLLTLITFGLSGLVFVHLQQTVYKRPNWLGIQSKVRRNWNFRPSIPEAGDQLANTKKRIEKLLNCLQATAKRRGKCALENS